MSEIIHGQVLYLLASTCCGMVCMFLYGFVRIFELFLKKNMILKIIIDVLFWMALSIPVFYIFYEINSGIIRWYGVFMLFAGMILYEKGIYTPAKKIIEKIINLHIIAIDIIPIHTEWFHTFRPRCRGASKIYKKS